MDLANSFASKRPDDSRRPVALIAVFGLFALVALSTGCASDARSGSGIEDEGEVGAAAPAATVQAFIQDESMSTEMEALRISSASADNPDAQTGVAPRGELVGNFIVSILSEDGFWVDVGQHTSMTIPLRDPAGGSAIAAMDEVPPGTYTQVRVLVCHSSVDLEPGSTVGDRTVDSATNLHITETGDVIVQRDIQPLVVEPGSRSELQIDLNSPGWLTEEAVQSGRISIPAFESEVAVAVREEG